MAVTANWFTNGPKHAMSDVDWVSDTIRVMLTTSSYAPNQDTHEFKSSVTNEVSGTGYAARGAALGTKTVTSDPSTNETRLDAADTVWSNATITARRAVIYKDSGVDGTSPLLGWVDFGVDVPVSAGAFTITWDPTGILKVVAA